VLFLHTNSPNTVSATFTEGESMSAPKHIIRQAKDASLPITMRVGKSGLTDSVVVELEGQLSSRSLIKVKVNRGLYAKDDLNTVWNVMAEKTNSSVVFARGNVAVFWRN
jgi:RNA-binding protein YhbY